jgi:hypothetical protein
LKKLNFLLSNLSEELLNQQKNHSAVPDECRVLRLARPPKDFLEKQNVLAIQLEKEFELSSEDKRTNPPHLSVWVDSLTTPEQAYSFLEENSLRKLVLRLEVEEIRTTEGNSEEASYSGLLDVIWVYLFQDIDCQFRDSRPGADGHSGITGLDEKSAPDGLTKNQKKLLRKDLRSKLAEIASKNCFLIYSN